MTQIATVEKVLAGGYAEISVPRKSACGHDCEECAGCGMTGAAIHARARNDVGAQKGDKVVVESSTKKLLGVVGSTPPHLLSTADREHNYKREDLFVDLGLPVDKVRAQVRIGDLITLHGPATPLLNDRCAAKTMDDRACVACLLEAAERLQKMSHICDIYFVATSQEEVGSKGASVAAHAIDPDLAVALDVTHATIPQSRPDTTVPLDAPAATYGPFVQYKLLERLKKAAKDHGIKLNTEHAERFTYTDLDNIQIAREGVPCEYHPIKNAMHGYDIAVNSEFLRPVMAYRIEFLRKVFTGR